MIIGEVIIKAIAIYLVIINGILIRNIMKKKGEEKVNIVLLMIIYFIPEIIIIANALGR